MGSSCMGTHYEMEIGGGCFQHVSALALFRLDPVGVPRGLNFDGPALKLAARPDKIEFSDRLEKKAKIAIRLISSGN